MASFNVTDLFKAVGLAAGANNVNASAAGALLKLQNSVNASAEKLGAKIGAFTGGNIFASLEKGARGADTAATDQLVSSNLGVSLTGLKAWGVAALAIVAAYLVFKD